MEKKGTKLGSYEDIYSENDLYLKKIEEESKVKNEQILAKEEIPSPESEQAFLEKKKNNIPTQPKDSDEETASAPKNKSPGKVKKSKPKSSGPKLFQIPNKRILSEQPDNITYTKCSRKSGYLSLVRHPSKLPGELHLYKIYVNLNLRAINLYLDSSSRTLFNSIKIEKILRISQQKRLQDNNCFDIITNDIEQGVEVLLKGPVTLCANSKKDMNDWINAILEFKECQINVQNLNGNKVIVDFTKVNELLKTKGGSGQNIPDSIKVKSLYYDNGDKAIIPSSARVSKEIWMKKAMENILQTIRRGNIKRNQVQRRMQNKLKEAKMFSMDVHKKQELIQQIIEKRLEKERERETQMVKMEQKNKEMELLRAVQKRITKMKEEEINQYKKSYSVQIQSEKKKANDEARKMMSIIVDQNKLTDYDDCTDSRLLFFKDESYVKKVCKIYYGEHREKQCTEKPNFCNMCCAHHVGIRFYHKLVECKSRCSNLLIGIDFRYAEAKKKHKKSNKKGLRQTEQNRLIEAQKNKKNPSPILSKKETKELVKEILNDKPKKN